MPRPKKINIQPLFDYVLVKPLEAQEKTASGIYLPESAKEKPQTGLVMAVGPGALSDDGKTLPMKVQVNQRVIYKKWGGNDVKVDHEEWQLMEQKDILAIVK